MKPRFLVKNMNMKSFNIKIKQVFVMTIFVIIFAFVFTSCSESASNADAKTVELNIEGMTCDGCANTITKSLEKTEGVSEADVSLEEKKAVVKYTGDDNEALVKAVEKVGYKATIKN